jgi:carbonic anhydrase/acetyltransferase-like protein (isoleucine patch superfamily)
VLEGTIVEENSIYAGVPAKKVKTVDSKRSDVFARTAKNYIMYSDWFRNE